MGVYLAPDLVERGFKVDITSRFEHPDEGDIHFILGDAMDDDFLARVISAHRYDVIIDFMVYATSRFKERYQFLLENCRHYIFLSSYRVFSDAKVITEETPRLLDVSRDETFLRTNDYSLEKARQENLLTASDKRNWTIVRPSITYSKNRFQLGTLEADTIIWRSINNKPVILPRAMLEKETTMTWAGDVAKMIGALTLKKDAMADSFNVVTSEHHTWRDVFRVYQSSIGLSLVPVSLRAYVQALGGGFNKYQVNYDRMFDRVLDNSKILKATGMKQADLKPLRDGLSSELESFMKSAQPNHVDLKRQRKIDYAINPLAASINDAQLVGRLVVEAILLAKRKLRIRTRYRDLVRRIRSKDERA